MAADSLEDVFVQTRALLARLDPAASPEIAPAARAGEVALLTPAEAAAALTGTRALLVAVGVQHLGYAVPQLVRLLETFPSAASAAEGFTGAAPSTSDRKENIEDVAADASAESWLMATLTALLSAAASPATGGGRGLRALSDLDESVYEAYFARLHFASSAAVRFHASAGLAALALAEPARVVRLFIEALGAVDKNSQREYVPYQRAVAKLPFSFATKARTKITLEYLGALAERMPTFDRGVLREAICSTLGAVLTRVIRGAPDATTGYAPEYVAFEATAHAPHFWTLFADIYKVVAKWAKKSKHALFSIALLQKMTTLANAAFYFPSRGEEWLSLAASALKDKSQRLDVLALVLAFFEELNPVFVHEQVPLFQRQVGVILPKFLSKASKNLSSEELELVVAILVAIGTLHVDSLLLHVTEALSLPNYPLAGQVAVLRALGALAHECPAALAPINTSLFPLVLPFMNESRDVSREADLALVRAALRCFPVIHDPDPARRKEVVKRLTAYVLAADRELHSAALAALCDYMLLSPAHNLIPVVMALSRTLLDFSREPEDIVVLRVINNIITVLTSFAQVLPDGAVDVVDLDAWFELRTRIEGMALLWYCHSDPIIHMELSRLMAVLDSAPLAAFEASGVGDAVAARPPRLASLVLDADGAPRPAFDAELDDVEPGQLARLLNERSHVVWFPALTALVLSPTLWSHYSVCISWAWCRLVERLTGQHSPDELGRSLPLGADHFVGLTLFMTAAVRFPLTLDDEEATSMSLHLVERMVFYVLKNMLSAHPLRARAGANALFNIHPSGWEYALKSIKAAVASSEAPPSTSDDGGERVRSNSGAQRIGVHISYYSLPVVTSVLSALLITLPRDIFTTNIPMYSLYHDVIQVWLDPAYLQLFDTAALPTKAAAADLVTHYILRTDGLASASARSALSAAGIVSRPRSLFQFLHNLLYPGQLASSTAPRAAGASVAGAAAGSNPEATKASLAAKAEAHAKSHEVADATAGSPEAQDLVCAIIRAVAALLQVGPLGDEALEKHILKFVSDHLYARGEVGFTQAVAEDALMWLLRHNTRHASLFVKFVLADRPFKAGGGKRSRSSRKADAKSERVAVPPHWPVAFKIAAFKALVRNVADDPATWLASVPLPKLVLLVLVTLSSPHILLRELAVQLALVLARASRAGLVTLGSGDAERAVDLDARAALPHDAGTDASHCLEAAVRYAAALAQRAPRLTAPLLRELVEWHPSIAHAVEAGGDGVPGAYARLLRTFAPFAGTIPLLVRSGVLAESQDVWSILATLFALTKAVVPYGRVLDFALQELWCLAVVEHSTGADPQRSAPGTPGSPASYRARAAAPGAVVRVFARFLLQRTTAPAFDDNADGGLATPDAPDAGVEETNMVARRVAQYLVRSTSAELFVTALLDAALAPGRDLVPPGLDAGSAEWQAWLLDNERASDDASELCAALMLLGAVVDTEHGAAAMGSATVHLLHLALVVRNVLRAHTPLRPLSRSLAYAVNTILGVVLKARTCANAADDVDVLAEMDALDALTTPPSALAAAESTLYVARPAATGKLDVVSLAARLGESVNVESWAEAALAWGLTRFSAPFAASSLGMYASLVHAHHDDALADHAAPAVFVMAHVAAWAMGPGLAVPTEPKLTSKQAVLGAALDALLVLGVEGDEALVGALVGSFCLSAPYVAIYTAGLRLVTGVSSAPVIDGVLAQWGDDAATHVALSLLNGLAVPAACDDAMAMLAAFAARAGAHAGPEDLPRLYVVALLVHVARALSERSALRAAEWVARARQLSEDALGVDGVAAKVSRLFGEWLDGSADDPAFAFALLDVVAEAWPGHGSWVFVLVVLRQLAGSGPVAWRWSALRLLHAALTRFSHYSLTASQFADVAELVVANSHSNDSRMAVVRAELLKYLYRVLPEFADGEIPSQVFNFVRATPLEYTAAWHAEAAVLLPHTKWDAAMDGVLLRVDDFLARLGPSLAVRERTVAERKIQRAEMRERERERKRERETEAEAGVSSSAEGKTRRSKAEAEAGVPSSAEGRTRRSKAEAEAGVPSSAEGKTRRSKAETEAAGASSAERKTRRSKAEPGSEPENPPGSEPERVRSKRKAKKQKKVRRSAHADDGDGETAPDARSAPDGEAASSEVAPAASSAANEPPAESAEDVRARAKAAARAKIRAEAEERAKARVKARAKARAEASQRDAAAPPAEAASFPEPAPASPPARSEHDDDDDDVFVSADGDDSSFDFSDS